MGQDCLTVLLVDDEEIIHQTLGEYLSECGHAVNSIFNGSAALEAIRTFPYDLALVDVRMPGLDGFTLLRRSLEIQPHMTVVLMTGHGDSKMSEEAFKLGAFDFLLKPVKLTDLDLLLKKIGPAD